MTYDSSRARAPKPWRRAACTRPKPARDEAVSYRLERRRRRSSGRVRLNALAPGPLDSTFAQAAARECSLPQERRSGQWVNRCLEPCALNGTKGAHDHHRALCK